MQGVLSAAEVTEDVTLRIHRAWIDNADTVCFVYEAVEQPHGLIGLRRVIEQGPEWTVSGIVDEILTGEMGEPLGSCFDTLRADSDGVLWWAGNLAEWKEPR